MAALSTQRTTCRLCEAAALQLALPLKPSPIADAIVPPDKRDVAQPLFSLDLYLCGACGHVQLTEVVDPQVLFGNYTYVTSSSLGLVQHFASYAEWAVTFTGAGSSDLVLEIGSNDGSLLKAFKAHGPRVLGVDPAREIAKRATENGTPTLARFFTLDLADEILRDHGRAKIIAANNVFAHSDKLAEMTDGIARLLTDDGVFMFEVSYLVDMVDRMVFDTVYHEHVSYHSIKPLQTFMRNHGMELIDVRHIPTKGGSIRCLTQRSGGARKVAAHVHELIAAEEKRGFFDLKLYRDWGARIDTAKNELLRTIDSIPGPVAGYGVSHTVTTLMHHFELGEVLDFLIDDNSMKQGMLSPGHHLPIQPPSRLLEDSPDSVVILAWNYATPIMGKNEQYLTNGGSWIIPLPEVKVIRRK